MSQIHAQYLQEMGITQWELSHPERLAGYQTELVKLPETCQLLLVSPEKPQGALAEMFKRVLKSIKLDLSQAQYVFAGCESDTDIAAKTLQSPLLSHIDGNNQQRRALWQQICSYE
ncbi:DNA polymerase III subunit psi [Vibrio sp. D173a]|uniref:DNA polymerase III subunit psi n=1 Tax=Vibrio sp. D173a TaxID=2836349 RepID=UPI0025550A4B|nr:DNA polymerase III subunit psi [Vibrio sp. D173a]MDK9758990.1 DNA polymerase III subunit psi [Vibrio sp. D173a]